MNVRFFPLFVFSLVSVGLWSQDLSPEVLLERSLQYHDPLGQWGTELLTLHINETRPTGPDRTSIVSINPREAKFVLDQKREDNHLVYEVENGECSFQLNGKKKISEEEREKFRLNCERAKTLRNYYTYLWGLPMKLKDDGTQLQEVKLASFMDKEAYRLKVTYEEAVGTDTWYFYFDPASYALIGYRFYHDEAANDGEYISLEDTQIIKGLLIPKKRNWYANKDDEFLGTDILER